MKIDFKEKKMFVDYLSEMHTPIKAMDTVLDIMYYKANEDGIFSGKYSQESAQQHMALLFCLQLVVKYLIKLRKVYYRKMVTENYR